MMTAVLEKHQKNCSIAKIIWQVQDARRAHQYEYCKSLNVPAPTEEADDERTSNVKGEKIQTIAMVKERMKAILQALENYRE